MLKWNSIFLKIFSFFFAIQLSLISHGKNIEPGGFIIHSNAHNTSVLANGFLVGRSKEIIYLPIGVAHKLVITAPGFMPQQMTIELKSNQVKELRVELKKLSNNSGEEESNYGSVRGLPKPKKSIVDFSEEGEDPPPVEGPQHNAPFNPEEDSSAFKATLNFTLKISPFGIPQFAKGDVGFGVLAAVIQGAGLGMSTYYYWTGGRYKTTANEELSRIKDPAAWDNYKKKSDEYLNGQYNKQMIYLGVFFAAWGLSVFDAFRVQPQYKKPRIGFWGMPYGQQFVWGSHIQYDF